MNLIDRDNVLKDITDDIVSVYKLEDEDIINRLNFLKATLLVDDWFDDKVFTIFKLLRTVANQKNLLKSVQRSSPLMKNIFRQIADKDYPGDASIPTGLYLE